MRHCRAQDRLKHPSKVDTRMSASLILLELAAWLHLMQVPGTFYVGRRIIGISAELPRLSALTAAIFMVLGIAVVFILVGLGVLVEKFLAGRARVKDVTWAFTMPEEFRVGSRINEVFDEFVEEAIADLDEALRTLDE